MLRQLPTAVVIRSAEGGRLLLANAEAERLLGRPVARDTAEEAVAGYGFRHLDGRPVTVDDLPVSRMLRTGAPVRDALEFIRPTGERIVLQCTAGPLRDTTGRVTAAVVTFADRTDSERQYAEADLRVAEELGQRADVAVDNARRHHAPVESLSMLDAMLASSPVGHAFVDRDLRYVRVNQALATLHGVSIEAHLGRPVREVLPTWAPVLEPLYSEVLTTAQPVLDRELLVPSPSGNRYELLVNCFPVRDAAGVVRWVSVTKTDVTEQRHAERALRASEARLRRIVELPLIGIGFYDQDGRITSANQALCDLLGYTPGEVAAGAVRWDTNFTPPEYRWLDRKAGREVEASGVSRPYEKELFRRDGTRVPVLAGGARLDDDGRSGVFYVLDLTERRRVEEQVQAAQRLEAVGRLAGGVAHEVNNALQGVLGFNAFVLRRLAPDDPVRGDAEQVQRSGERAAQITQQLLAYSRRQVLRSTDLDLVQVVNDFTPILRQALGPDRQLMLSLMPGGIVVHADRAQLEQVLLNLTLNAHDAMAQGGRLSINVGRRRVTSKWLAEHLGARLYPGVYVQLTVEDTGCGMDAATRARVFEPFFTTKEPGEGTGLGLSVVQGIVQQSGGYIWVESEPRRGSTFNILLPGVQRTAAAGPALDSESAIPGSTGHEVILVVDDEPTIRTFAGALLRDAGYEVLEAADGQQALDIVAERAGGAGPRIDLVLTDIVMPSVGGRALAEQLTRRTPELPVVYTSGYTGDEAVRRGMVDADAAFLQKPFTPERLLHLVRAVLDARGPRGDG